MATTGSVALSNQTKPVYDAAFFMQSQAYLYFDQLTDLRKEFNGQGGLSYNYVISANLPPQTANLSELSDVTPIPLSSAELSVTLYEHGSAVQVAEYLVATSYVDVYKQAAYANGYNLAESFDNIVRAVACQGSMLLRQNNRATRVLVDGQGTVADLITPNYLQLLTTIARKMRMPMFEDGTYCTIMDTFVHHDLIISMGSNTMAYRQTPEMLFNGEVGYWAGLRILTSANTKAFYGQGAVSSSSGVTTLNGATAAGATTIVVTSATNLIVGNWIAIADATETGNTWSDTNELALITAVSGTTLTVMGSDPGPGTGGGLRYAHASGTVVNDSNTVYPLPIMGPQSITKVASTHTGPFGRTTVTGPFDYLGRFLALGWYAIVGWNRTLEGWILRGECGSSTS